MRLLFVAFRALAVALLGLSTAARADVASDATPYARSTAIVSQIETAGGPAGARSLRVRYRSTDGRGRPIEVTGWVFVPIAARPNAPILAWAHGTWGVAGRCAITGLPALVAATPALADMIAHGYVVAATDYPGLGSPGPHPYLVGESAGRAVIDIVRVAGQLGGGKRFAVWGESQGGYAALWTARLARRYGRGVTLVGVAAAAPPTDLVANLTGGSDPSIRAFLTAFTADSWSRHYGAPLATLGRPATVGIIRRLAQNNCVELDAKPKLGMVIGVLALRRDLRGVDMGQTQPWAQLARVNSVTPAAFAVPVLLAQNPADKIVDPAVTRRFARALCGSGDKMTWIDIAGAGHATSARDSAGATLDWIDDRFAGKVAPNACGRI